MRLTQACFLAVIALLTSTTILAQELSPKQKLEASAFKKLILTVSVLPMDRVELKVSPPMTLVGISAVSADKVGNLYIIHRPSSPMVDPIVVVDSKGRFLRSWGKGVFVIPHGIRIDPAGNVWAVDAHTSKVFKFTPSGKKLLEIVVGDVPNPSEAFCGTTDVAFGRSGHVFVADGYCNARVIEYAANGKKLRQWGKRGTGVGEFDHVHSIAISADGILYVADRENDRLQWFDQNGKALGQKTFSARLFSVAIGSSGELYVGLQPLGVPNGTNSTIFRLNPRSGRIQGRVDAFAHQLSIGPNGTLLPGPRADSQAVLLLRPRKKLRLP